MFSAFNVIRTLASQAFDVMSYFTSPAADQEWEAGARRSQLAEMSRNTAEAVKLLRELRDIAQRVEAGALVGIVAPGYFKSRPPGCTCEDHFGRVDRHGMHCQYFTQPAPTK